MRLLRLVLLIGFVGGTVAARAAPQAVATRMRHVFFDLGMGIELRVDDLAGRLLSTTKGPPVFDDVRSYVVAVDSARVAITPESLTNLMNNYVFAADDAPFKKIKITVESQELVQSGVLRKGIPVPFTMRASIAATPDGKIRLHPSAMKAAGFVSKRVLDFFGVELEDLVKMKGTSAVVVDGDDLLLDPERLLPPPQIRGRLTRIALENGLIVEQFGRAMPSRAIAPPNSHVSNYMYYRGGTLRFGKLTMIDADLLLVDADPRDPFAFSPQKYNDQLVAGYSKNTRAHGLIVYMPDLGHLRAAPRPETAHEQPAERQHHK